MDSTKEEPIGLPTYIATDKFIYHCYILVKNKDERIRLKNLPKDISLVELVKIKDIDGSIDFDNNYDVDYDSDGTIMGVNEEPEYVIIKNRGSLDNIVNLARKTNAKEVANNIELFLKKDNEDWRCAKCSRYLGITLNNLKQITDLLFEFSVKQLKKCHKCRKANGFTISENGEFAAYCN